MGNVFPWFSLVRRHTHLFSPPPPFGLLLLVDFLLSIQFFKYKVQFKCNNVMFWKDLSFPGRLCNSAFMDCSLALHCWAVFSFQRASPSLRFLLPRSLKTRFVEIAAFLVAFSAWKMLLNWTTRKGGARFARFGGARFVRFDRDFRRFVPLLPGGNPPPTTPPSFAHWGVLAKESGESAIRHLSPQIIFVSFSIGPKPPSFVILR